MIWFATDTPEKHRITETLDFRVCEISTGFMMLAFATPKIEEYVCQDTETTGLDPYVHDVLLYILGNENVQVVFDVHSNLIGFDLFLHQFFDNFKGEVIGQNVKFDTKFNKTKFGFHFRDKCKVYDTMIADQRLYLNTGFKFALPDIYARHFKEVPIDMDKNIRQEFVGMSLSQISFENRHIQYAANDIKYLPAIREKQKALIAKYNQEFLIYDIEFPLITTLAKAELEGFVFNKEKWKVLIELNKKKKFEAEKKLDELIFGLRDKLFEKGSYEYLSLVGGKFSRERREEEFIVQTSLFGDVDNKTIKSNSYKGNIDYGSVTEIAKIFAKLGQVLPAKEDDKGYEIMYLIPTFNKAGKLESGIGIDRQGKRLGHCGFTTQEDFLQAYLIERPDSIMKEFIETLLEYRTAKTRIENFGENFFEKINPVTGKIHTVYRQCASETGRLQSGGGKKEPDKFNSQNIIAEKAYRECFEVEDGYSFNTADLSGAELVIVCDKAEDLKLLELSKGDMHSHLANKAWKAVYNHRGFPYTENDVISKKQHSEKRTAFKPMGFGAIYGMKAKKAAKTLNVAIEEGKLILESIYTEIPATFAYITRTIESVLGKKTWGNEPKTYGNPYLILNTRTNSRIWFPDIMYAKKNNTNLTYVQEKAIDGALRNSPIQGTQADMIKEALVNIDMYIEKYNLDACILVSVHDEIGTKFNNNIENFPEFIGSTMTNTANEYLSVVRMGVEYHTGKSWTK